MSYKYFPQFVICLLTLLIIVIAVCFLVYEK
jgi:hypothetical protein